MYRNLPNLLTIARAVLAGVFFLVLNQYRYGSGPAWVLWASIGLFAIAAITDWLDGMLARRWHVESQFGRIMDPFCDKVLVIGAFIYLAGPRFVDPEAVRSSQETAFHILKGNMVSGVYPWMVALILARELLVTGIRGELEGQGVSFGANRWGKAKLIMQAIIVPVILFIVWLYPRIDQPSWLAITRNVLVYATVLVTVGSGIPYITRARAAMRKGAE